MNDPVALTAALNAIEGAVVTGFGLIQGEVADIYGALLKLSLILTFAVWIIDGRAMSHVALIWKFVQFAVLAWILTNFQVITGAISEAMIETGLKAGADRMSAADFRDPGAIAATGLTAMTPILDHMDSLTGFPDLFYYVPELAIYGIVLLFVMLGFIVLAWQVFFAILEFLILSLGAFVAVPFAVWNKTSFIAERAMGYIVATGLKLFVLALVLSIVSSALLNIAWSAEPSIREALGVLALAGAGFISALWAPRKAMGLVNGGPVMEAGSALLSLWAAARLSGGLVRGVASNTAGAYRSIRSGFSSSPALPPRGPSTPTGPTPPPPGAPHTGGAASRFAAGLASHRDGGSVTAKQAYSLRRHGLDPSGFTRGTASRKLAEFGHGPSFFDEKP